MAGRDTQREPGAGGEEEGLTLAELATMGLPLELILDQIVRGPGNSAEAIINLGMGQNRAFRDRLRYIFSRSPSYALLRHLSADEIAHLSRVMGDAVAQNLRWYKVQFLDYYMDLFDLDTGVVDTSVLEKILGQTELLQHRSYRDMIRDWFHRLMKSSRMFNRPPVDYLQDVRILRLMSIVGLPMDGVVARAVRRNNLEAARYAIEELGLPVTPNVAYELIWTWNSGLTWDHDDIFIYNPDMFRLVTENASDDIDTRVHQGMRRIVSWHGHPEFANDTQAMVQMLDILRRAIRNMDDNRGWSTPAAERDLYRQQLEDAQRAFDLFLASVPE
jgi:hypothetical protein